MRSVLAVGAHPDDIELGCGGTLAAHRAAGDSVTMLVVTGGQNGPGDIDGRRREAEAAARSLDCLLIWGSLRDCEVAPDLATIALIERAMADVGADVVYVHAPDDSHQDHRAVAAATVSAARHSLRVLHYRSPSTTRFEPTVFVDISAHLARKIDALSCHRSQVENSAMVDPEVVAASARHFGAQARVRYAESFVPGRFVWDLTPPPALPQLIEVPAYIEAAA
ncbi:PIG-L deacetylase family protein [Actinoplanes couchii]|nr:PIG-L deacetylase family protein [Actinoplanes couchii]